MRSIPNFSVFPFQFSVLKRVFLSTRPNFLSEVVRCGASQKIILWDSTRSTAQRIMFWDVPQMRGLARDLISCQKSRDVVHRKRNHSGIVLKSTALSGLLLGMCRRLRLITRNYSGRPVQISTSPPVAGLIANGSWKLPSSHTQVV